MTKIQERTGTLLRTLALADGATLNAPDFVAKEGANAVVYFVRATGVCTAEVFRVAQDDIDATIASQMRGVPKGIEANIEEPIAFNYPLHRSRIRIVNTSGGAIDVSIDVDQGGVA